MKFKIIWIDDSNTWVKSIQRDVTEAFESMDFAPEIEVFQETTKAKALILRSYVDLILVDCNLPDGSRGDAFIKELRQCRCFAHVIFYSQDSDNLTALQEDKHFIHVTPRDSISEILEQVADQAYRKYKHPAFMRGLLLSEFIDLENLMEDLISSCFKNESDFFRKNIIHKGGESFSLAAKQKFIMRLINDAKILDDGLKDKIQTINLSSSQFDKCIIKKRNILAHAYPSYDADTGKIKLVSAIEDINFDSDWFHETREGIHEHKRKIHDLAAMELHKIVNP